MLTAQAQEDIVFKAMHDELDRSMKLLHLEQLEKPYFISYRVIESESTTVSGRFGALQSSTADRGRLLTVEVRVGDYKLDNTNFISANFNQSSLVQIFGGTMQLPLDNDYKELRREIWLATDSTYKKALEDLSKKRAALQNKVNNDEVPDFTKEDPVTTTVDAPIVHADVKKWEAEARTLSGLFRQMPGINSSYVSFQAANTYIRYLNSDGTSYLRHEPKVTFNVGATTQAPDGSLLNDGVWVHARSLAALPSTDELAAKVRTMGQHLTDLRTAAELQNYNGPVLAEGDAAPQLFELVFVPHLLGTHRILMDSQFGQQRGVPENPFVDKIGARVLPEFLSVIDNPERSEFNNVPLEGSSKVDEDGVRTRATTLVDKGFLNTLLVTRNPIRGIEHSTGSRHAGQAMPSNLFVTTDNGLTRDELRAKFQELVKRRKKDYGIIVRRMRSASSPLLAYKVFPDGREELIHGVQFADLNVGSFKDIIAASKDINILTVEYFPQRNGGMTPTVDDQYMPVTLAVPSLLFEDVTVHKIRGETPKPPVAPHPFFESK
jgi:predicted Zn-dependent protease